MVSLPPPSRTTPRFKLSNELRDASTASPASPLLPQTEMAPASRVPEVKRIPSSVEKIWGRNVVRHGYAGIPSILIRSQKQLNLTPIQMNIIIHLLDYWHEPTRKPFPTKQELADRINVTSKTIQNNVRQLEKAGLIYRQIRKTASGDFNSNIYNLEPLVRKIQAIEPVFQTAREGREKARKEAEALLRQHRT